MSFIEKVHYTVLQLDTSVERMVADYQKRLQSLKASLHKLSTSRNLWEPLVYHNIAILWWEFVGNVHGTLAQCFCSQTVSFINCYWYSEFDLPCLQCPSLPPSFFLCRSELEYEKRKGMLQELSDKYISCCLFVGKHTLLFCMWSCLCCVQVQTIGDG